MNKPGDRVTIYLKPHLNKLPEGKAELIKKWNTVTHDGLEYWDVRFDGKSLNEGRWIRNDASQESEPTETG